MAVELAVCASGGSCGFVGLFLWVWVCWVVLALEREILI